MFIAFIIKKQYLENICKNEINPLQVCINDSSMSHSFLVTKETAVVGPGCLSGLQCLVAMFGCNVWLQCLVIRFGYMGYNRQLVETKTARSARLVYLQNPFQIVNLREKIKNIFLCWKPFTNYIYWIKKESINNNYNGLQGIGPPVDRLICKPFSNRKFERDKTKPLSLLRNILQTILLE